MAARLNLLFIAALLGGCFDPGEGVAPPAERVYFPVGLALDTESRFLYVANSDFDLQYNAGTLQSFDLEELRARVPRGCVADDDCSSEEFCDLDPTSENLGLPSKTCVPSEGEFAGMPCGPSASGQLPIASWHRVDVGTSIPSRCKMAVRPSRSTASRSAHSPES